MDNERAFKLPPTSINQPTIHSFCCLHIHLNLWSQLVAPKPAGIVTLTALTSVMIRYSTARPMAPHPIDIPLMSSRGAELERHWASVSCLCEGNMGNSLGWKTVGSGKKGNISCFCISQAMQNNPYAKQTVMMNTTHDQGVETMLLGTVVPSTSSHTLNWTSTVTHIHMYIYIYIHYIWIVISTK